MRNDTRTLRYPATAILFGCLALLALTPAAARGQGQTQTVVVFGDSLSDPGNGFAFVTSNATPPDYSLNSVLIPGAPYARGGHHLSNGPTWIEQLALSLGATRSVQPAFVGSNPYAMNFAVGTARARSLGPASPDLVLQIAAFLQKVGGRAPSDALYVVQFGGNDVRDALATGNPIAANQIVQSAAQSIAAGITALYSAGARRFVVWNAPDVGLTPAARIADLLQPGTAVAANQLTQAFNAYLLGYLFLAPNPVAGLPGIQIVPFDAYTLVGSIVAAPWLFDLTNATDACVMPGTPPFTCQAPDDYLFWDGVHPTAAGHAIIARAVAESLG
jgi:phospholipase/lecithinase/hemolysin